MPPSAGLGGASRSGNAHENINVQNQHAHLAPPFLIELSVVLYLSGNTPALVLVFAWLWTPLIMLSRTLLSDMNADANTVQAEGIGS